MAKTKVNCHLCGTEIERQLAKGIEKYSCADCKLKRSREWAKNKVHSRVSDIRGTMKEFICEHGVGHHNGIHGCDGCCDKPENQEAMSQTTRD